MIPREEKCARIGTSPKQEQMNMGILAKSLLRPVSSQVSVRLPGAGFCGTIQAREFQVRLWDGTTWGAEKQPRFTLVLKHPESLQAMFHSPSELTLGEAYIHDDFDIEGDIEAVFDLADYLLGQKRSLGTNLDLKANLQKLPKSDVRRTGLHLVGSRGAVHSQDRDRLAIGYHYDLPAEFYALWLDPNMVYSCAYFDTPELCLDAAQVQKLDYICKKLGCAQASVCWILAAVGVY
jgi:cyclopropane-fatty-acyl-phospholipid synthase